MGAEFVRILPRLLWIALAAVVIYTLRADLRALVKAIVERIPTLEKISAFGFSLEARVSTLEENLNQQALADEPKRPQNGTPVQPTETLKELANGYEDANNIRPRDARVRRKDELAALMAAEVRHSGVSREALASARQVGLGVALAASVVAAGEQSDLQMLSRLLPLLGWPPHARNRLVHAITATMQRRQTFSPTDVEAVYRLLDDIERTREANLPRAVKNVRDLLASRLAQEPSGEETE